MKEIYDYLKKNPTFFLATEDGNQPRVRPFGVVAEFEGKLYISTGKQKNVFKQMQENPKIELCAMGQDHSWLRVEATAVHDDRVEARARMLEENPNISGMYKADDDNMAVLYLKDATGTICSFSGEPKVYKF